MSTVMLVNERIDAIIVFCILYKLLFGRGLFRQQRIHFIMQWDQNPIKSIENSIDDETSQCIRLYMT